MKRARHWATLLIAAGLVLALASGLAACGGAADGDPPPTEAQPATPELPAAPAEATATAKPAASDEPPVLEASTPTDAPVSTATAASEPTAEPGESPTGDPSAATDEAEALPLLYDTYDLTGAVAEPGHYVFLEDADDPSTAITTYEGLRDGSTTGLVIHQNDSAGASQAAFYDEVAVGDLVEWRETYACWVRYRVTDVKDDPAGDPPRKLLAVKAYSHAYTGCSGAIRTTGSRTFTWTPTLVQQGNITVPIWHGPFLVAPTGWTATTLPEPTPRTPNTGPWPPSIDEMPDPDLGPGWTGGVVPAEYGALRGGYNHSDGGNLMVYIYPLRVSPFSVRPIDNADTDGVLEYFLLDGRPARVGYDREWHITSHAVNSIIVYDEARDLIYAAHGGRRADGNDPTHLIALMRKFLADASPPSAEIPQPPTTPPEAPILEPPAEPTAMPGEPSPPTAASTAPEAAPLTLLYDTYDRSGAVAEPGHYVFLADAADPASVVTTYEGLRDGTATALLIHTHDAHGVSQAAFYDDVETGDLVEWKQADDCFVRYTVTEAPAPAAGAPARSFGVAWMTYAFTGCSGAISTVSGSAGASTTAVSVTWGAALPDLGGTSLTVPVVHGAFQIVPAGWEGVVEETFLQPPPQATRDTLETIQTTWMAPAGTLARAAELPYWRTPALPDTWTFTGAGLSRDVVPYGYIAEWTGPGESGHLVIDGTHAQVRRWPHEASRTLAVTDELFVKETRIIAGRPAYVSYTPAPNGQFASIRIYIYDPATEAQYRLAGIVGGVALPDVASVIAIARSLFEPPNAP